MNILIIGYGVVGKNVNKTFTEADVYDIKNVGTGDYGKYDFAFICVPTDSNANGICNTTIVESVIEEWKDRVSTFIIRSTVPPGFTERYQDIAIFQPEYYGSTQHANCNDYDFIILGGIPELTAKAADLYKEKYTGRLKIYKTDSATAELVKYMENSWLAMKVTFCNEFYRLAEKLFLDYDVVRELWLADPRISPSHTFVYRDHPFYDSHCLNKDIPAIIASGADAGYDMQLMRAVKSINESFKADHGQS